MIPVILIALGIAVLLFGMRLSVLGAAVGGLVGLVVAQLFPEATTTTQLAIIIGLALVGFFAITFARGIIEVVILVIGALGGAAVVMALLNLFNIDEGPLNWLLALAGGVIGLMLMRRSRRGSKDWGMVILADLVGALLILRGLVLLLNLQRNSLLYTLILVGLLVVGFIFQGGFLNRRKPAASKKKEPDTPKKKEPPPASVKPSAVEPPAPVKPSTVAPPAAEPPAPVKSSTVESPAVEPPAPDKPSTVESRSPEPPAKPPAPSAPKTMEPLPAPDKPSTVKPPAVEPPPAPDKPSTVESRSSEPPTKPPDAVA